MILQSNDMTSLFRTWTQEEIIVAGGFDTCIGSYMPIRHSGLVLYTDGLPHRPLPPSERIYPVIRSVPGWYLGSRLDRSDFVGSSILTML